MYRLGERRPVLFEFVLVAIAFLAAAFLSVVANAVCYDFELSASAARIVTGAALLVLYRRALRGGRPLANLRIVVPALLFAAWNLFYNFSSGMALGDAACLTRAAVTALAPAVFEEALFRVVFLYNLQRGGAGDRKCLLISAAVFAAIHLTNIVGMDGASVALQAAYALVVGLVFGAVYLKNGSALQIVFAHFLTDFTNRIYAGHAASATAVQLILFGVLLAAEAVFTVRLIGAPAPTDEGTS